MMEKGLTDHYTKYIFFVELNIDELLEQLKDILHLTLSNICSQYK